MNRYEDYAQKIAQLVDTNQSIELIGMKNVGITTFVNNYLLQEKPLSRFSKYKHSLVLCEINMYDLIEINTVSFYQLFLKRILEKIEELIAEGKLEITLKSTVPHTVKATDLLTLTDTTRYLLEQLKKKRLRCVIIFNRFDRIFPILTKDLIINLFNYVRQLNYKTTYLFTSYRPLSNIIQDGFFRTFTNGQLSQLFIQPLDARQAKQTIKKMAKQFNLKLSSEDVEQIAYLSGGHVKYIVLLVSMCATDDFSTKKINIQQIADSEEISLLSEEIFKSLTTEERSTIASIAEDTLAINKASKDSYLFKSNIVDNQGKVFSPLFASYIAKLAANDSTATDTIYLTRKEQSLYDCLLDHIDAIVDRETITRRVWPEFSQLDIFDWTIDKLVGRLRSKLKLLEPEKKIITVRTRGYKLVSKNPEGLA